MDSILVLAGFSYIYRITFFEYVMRSLCDYLTCIPNFCFLWKTLVGLFSERSIFGAGLSEDAFFWTSHFLRSGGQKEVKLWTSKFSIKYLQFTVLEVYIPELMISTGYLSWHSCKLYANEMPNPKPQLNQIFYWCI